MITTAFSHDFFGHNMGRHPIERGQLVKLSAKYFVGHNVVGLWCKANLIA